MDKWSKQRVNDAERSANDRFRWFAKTLWIVGYAMSLVSCSSSSSLRPTDADVPEDADVLEDGTEFCNGLDDDGDDEVDEGCRCATDWDVERVFEEEVAVGDAVYTGAKSLWVAQDGVAFAIAERFGVVSNVGVVVRYDGQRWEMIEDEAFSRGVESIWGASGGFWGALLENIYIVNSYGEIIRYNGTRWQFIEGIDEACRRYSGGLPNFYSVWGGAWDNVFVSGSGCSFHYDGERWAIGYWGDEAIWVDQQGHLYSTGNTSLGEWVGEEFIPHSNCIVVRWEHAEDRFPVDLYEGPMDESECYRIWGSSSEDLYIIGNPSLHYDGVEWNELEPWLANDGRGSRDLWGSADDDVYMVGDDGMVARFDGVSWEELDIGTDEDLVGVSGSSRNNVFVISSVGTVYHRCGAAW